MASVYTTYSLYSYLLHGFRLHRNKILQQSYIAIQLHYSYIGVQFVRYRSGGIQVIAKSNEVTPVLPLFIVLTDGKYVLPVSPSATFMVKVFSCWSTNVSSVAFDKKLLGSFLK